MKTQSTGCWERHFGLWKELRSREHWKSHPTLSRLCLVYNDCLSEKIPDPCKIIEELKRDLAGKHSLYQSVWNWNALAFQFYKFHCDFEEARRCLEEGLRTATRLAVHSYGKEQNCVEAVWLILLLNFVRLDFREGQRERAAGSLNELRGFLAGEPWKPAVFGAAFAGEFEAGAFRFSFHPELVSFLSQKLLEEAHSRNSKFFP